MHVTANSKEVKPGSIFFALQGSKFDGHQFIEEAFKAGASRIYCERELESQQKQNLQSHLGQIEVLGSSARRKLGELASEMCGFPTQKLIMIGVTGTSGKTTTTYLIQHLLNSIGYSCARLGTNGGSFKDRTWETNNTTPDALTLQKWFQEVLDLGATHVVMEVSSHSLHQDRPWGTAWDEAIFLNLSAEHLDYHPNLEEYFSAKKILFTDHAQFSRAKGKKPILLSNEDTKFGNRLGRTEPGVETFSALRQITRLLDTPTGLKGVVEFLGKKHHFECPLFGNFQKDNLLAALSSVVSLLPHTSQRHDMIQKMLAGLKSFPGVPGRMESVSNSRGIFVLVDYAHKPEALEKVLLSIQGKRIITVFGCGGDRDKTKRPVMGAIAARLSNEVILTSDNPRTEDPLVILKEIEDGLRSVRQDHFEVIPDRALAIRKAIEIAKSGDIVLIAGKGHEDYQIFGTEKRHFDDREEARKVLA